MAWMADLAALTRRHLPEIAVSLTAMALVVLGPLLNKGLKAAAAPLPWLLRYGIFVLFTTVGAGLLPWLHYQDRTIFYFYAVSFVPYLCLAVAMMVGAFLGPPGAGEGRRMWGAVGAGTLVLLIIWNFIYFFPIYTGMTIPYSGWQARMWFDSWV